MSEAVDALAVPPGAFAFRGGKHFAGGGEVLMTGDNFTVFFEPDQHGPGAGAADEIAGAIDGIDDPAAAALRFAHGAFFAQ